MAFAWDVADDFKTIGQTHFRDLTQRGVRLFRGRRVNARAHAALLRTRTQMA